MKGQTEADMNDELAIFTSSCLVGKRCLYHGWPCTFALPALRALEARGFRIVDACPEMLGGLTCPRRASYIFDGVVYQSRGTKGQKNVTPHFALGAQLALEILEAARPVAVALLLKDSPSCDPDFGIFGRQAARLVKVIACKRGTEWEAELQKILGAQWMPRKKRWLKMNTRRGLSAMADLAEPQVPLLPVPSAFISDQSLGSAGPTTRPAVGGPDRKSGSAEGGPQG